MKFTEKFVGRLQRLVLTFMSKKMVFAIFACILIWYGKMDATAWWLSVSTLAGLDVAQKVNGVKGQ